MSQTISLTFLRNHGPYTKGAVATFPIKIGHDLIEKKIAVEYVEPETKVAKKTKPLPDRHTATKSIVTK